MMVITQFFPIKYQFFFFCYKCVTLTGIVCCLWGCLCVGGGGEPIGDTVLGTEDCRQALG